MTPFRRDFEYCTRKYVPEICHQLLQTPEGKGSARLALLNTVCDSSDTKHRETCCRGYAGTWGSIKDKVVGQCGVLCFLRDQKEYCSVFTGPEGQANQAIACRNYAAARDKMCAGLPADVLATIRGQSAAEDREKIARAERERKAREIAERQTQQAPSPPKRRSCQYMFVTGGSSPSGWTKAERHFYDAPDCGGACCEGQSVCCVDGRGIESCSQTTKPNYAEPEPQFCRGGGRFRDQRRDDHPVLPVLPGEKYKTKPL